MGTEFADYNGDGRLDLVVTNHEFETHSLFRNEGQGTFVDASVEAGIASQTLPFVGFGVAFFDADNSGDVDIAIHVSRPRPASRPREAFDRMDPSLVLARWSLSRLASERR